MVRAVIALLALAAGAFGSSLRSRQTSGQHWVDTWAAMPQLTESTNLPPSPFNRSGSVFANSTIRQTIHTSIGGSQIRIRISNAFSDVALPINAVTVALPVGGAAGASAIQTATLKTVTFSGRTSFSIPNGALVVSDPITFTVQPQSMLTITLFTSAGQASRTNSITSHPGSRTTSWFTIGDQSSAADISGSKQSAAHCPGSSSAPSSVLVPTSFSAFAIVGDSITDGRGSDDNKNNRWPDLVLARMQQNAATSQIAVINQAAGGNRILADGLGPNALGRIERDVLSHSGVKFAMIFEGVNDLGDGATTSAAQNALADDIIFAYQQIIARVHTFGIPIFAATISALGSGYWDPTREAARQTVNTWIRNSGAFDAVIDFDAILRSPQNASQLNPQFNSGDGLHPNVAGYQAVANAFPLDVFSRFA